MRRSALQAALLLLVLAVASCGRVFRQPEVALEGVRLGSVGLTGGQLLVNLRVTNPNPFSLRAQMLRYTLQLDRAGESGDTSWVDFASGEYDRGFSVGGGQTSTVEIPVEFTYSGLGSAGLSLIRSGTFNYRARGTVDVDTPLGLRQVPFSRRGVMSLSGAR